MDDILIEILNNRRTQSKWTESDISYLSDNYGKKDISDIADYLGRNINAIHAQTHRMGLKKPTLITPEKETEIKNRYQNERYAIIAKDLVLKEHNVSTFVSKKVKSGEWPPKRVKK